jgi:uncharacterized protein YcgI (DUF1989 family)
MRKCRNVARLLSETGERTLPWASRAGVRLHLLICSACRRYAAQLRWLSRTYRQVVHATDTAGLTREARMRISAALDAHRDSPKE